MRRTYRHEVVSTDAGSGLRQPSGRSLHPAALYCLMLYLFELMANATLTKGINAPNQGTQCLFQAVSGNSCSFAAFLMEHKMGT